MLVDQFLVGGVDHLHELLVAVFWIREVVRIHHAPNIGLDIELV